MIRYPYLLFDADNTLLDFEKNSRRAFRLLCAKWHFPCTEQTRSVYEGFNEPLWRQAEQGLITKDFLKRERFRLFLDYLKRDEDPDAVNQDFMTFLGASSFLMPHAEEVCASLAADHALYILTNSVASVHIDRMQQSLLRPYIRASFISESIGYEKPSIHFFEYVQAHIPGLTRDNCLLIGDSLSSDIQGGINAGIPVCWYNPHHKEAPANLSIDYTIHDLRELLPLLK